MQRDRRGVLNEEQGFAALIIAIVLVTVLSLITVGFAQLMRDEQRSALERRLSSSAFYAAESGINDANRAIQGGYIKAKTKCDNTPVSSVDYTLPGSEYLKNNNVDTTKGTKYTCLFIDPTPADLQYSSIAVNKATTAIITGADSTGSDAPISKLVFSWQDDNGDDVFTPAGSYSNGSNSWLPPLSGWNNGGAITGMLRISITPLANLTRDNLINDSYTAFLYPEPASTPTAKPTLLSAAQSMAGHTGLNSGELLNGACNTSNTPRYCAVAIDLGPYVGVNFALHLSSVYRSSAVTVTPYDSTNSKMYIKGAQTVIDSTGKAEYVLKRIQVRIPARNSFDYPEFDLQTAGDICKQLSVYPPNASTGTPGLAVNPCSAL